MGGNIVLNLIKTTFAGIIVIVLCIVLEHEITNGKLSKKVLLFVRYGWHSA